MRYLSMATRVLIGCAMLAVVGCGSLPVAPGATGRAAVDARDRLHATRDGAVIQVHPIGFRFAIPKDWLVWHKSFGDNLHLTTEELDAAKRGRGEWNTEFGKVCNAIFPFAKCAAHVGEGGWGDTDSRGGLQVRFYQFNESADAIGARIDRDGTKAVTRLTKRPAKPEFSVHGQWRRALVKYRRFYIDYGGTAHVDIRYREFGPRTIVFVFMYVTDYEFYADTISTMLSSLTPPSQD